ncbi:MAG TPA: hypothetical protein VGQ34_05580, partial [Sphingomicrobium sp.]|nr:hypothetical protein [Sphingomicrobium sp.]
LSAPTLQRLCAAMESSCSCSRDGHHVWISQDTVEMYTDCLPSGSLLLGVVVVQVVTSDLAAW